MDRDRMHEMLAVGADAALTPLQAAACQKFRID